MDVPAVSWNVSVAEAKVLQAELAKKVILHDDFGEEIRLIAGVDVAYETDGSRVYAGVVVLDGKSLELVETQAFIGESSFPYVPGLFAFRELPHVLAAFEKLKNVPDMVVCDGQGIAHPRRCGLASHLGLLLDLPTIGCGKTRHIGEYEEPAFERGSHSPLLDEKEVIGSALRTQEGVKPLFVSVGHRVSLETARSWILRLANQYRQPEPIRDADQLVNRLRATSGKS